MEYMPDFDTNLVLYVQGCSEQSALFCYLVFFNYFSLYLMLSVPIVG